MTMHYFAMDGNYGDSAGMILVDTTDWTEEQWTEIEEASDYDRVTTAVKIGGWNRISKNGANNG